MIAVTTVAAFQKVRRMNRKCPVPPSPHLPISAFRFIHHHPVHRQFKTFERNEENGTANPVNPANPKDSLNLI
jgi:hypothetical protein